jgi:hypothetical protein
MPKTQVGHLTARALALVAARCRALPGLQLPSRGQMPRMPDDFKVEIDKDGWLLTAVSWKERLTCHRDWICVRQWSLRMRSSPSIVPADRLDRDVYLVLEDFGARAGCAWREADEAQTDLETVIRLILSGEYTYPVRVVAFNAIEGWSRDATSDVADAVAQCAIDTGDEVSEALQAFIAENSTKAFDLQLSLPLRGAA